MADVTGVDPRIYGQFAAQEAQQAKLQQDAQAAQALAQTRQAQAQREQADLALKVAQAPDLHRKAEDEHKAASLKALADEASMQKARTERGIQLWRIAQATGSPGAYLAGRRLFIQDAEDEQAIPQTMPDPETFDKMINTSLSVKDIWDHNEKAVERFTKGDTQKGLAYGILGSAHDPEALQEFFQHAPELGVPPALVQSLAQLPPEQLQQWAQDRLTTPAEKETARHNLASEAAQMGTVERQTAAQQETARHNRAMEARPVGGGAGGTLSAEDSTAIADAIIRGEQPPVLTGLYSKGAAVRAALARKGYNLADATTDWTATQAHLRTLNGAQQTRMRQAVDNAAHSLDVIDGLASQWKGGGFPPLNRVNLLAAKNGVYGEKVASVARQLEAQISDVTSELGNVYMGGNSPTDHALQLAGKNLSADWSEKVLKDMTNLARKNLQIRMNSMNNVGAVGATPDNPYAPPAPATASPAPSGGPTLTYQDYLKAKGKR